MGRWSCEAANSDFALACESDVGATRDAAADLPLSLQVNNLHFTCSVKATISRPRAFCRLENQSQVR